MSPHDYRMFLVVLISSSGIAIAVGGVLIRQLADDLRGLGTAHAIDKMASRLLDARRDQDRLAIARPDLLSNVGHACAIRAAVESVRDAAGRS